MLINSKLKSISDTLVKDYKEELDNLIKIFDKYFGNFVDIQK
jgi:hypothetical protein